MRARREVRNSWISARLSMSSTVGRVRAPWGVLLLPGKTGTPRAPAAQLEWRHDAAIDAATSSTTPHLHGIAEDPRHEWETPLMDKLSPPATAAGPSEAFTGPVWFDVLYRGAEPSRARVNAVH